MSSTSLLEDQTITSDIYLDLIEKLEELENDLYINQHYEVFYKCIGLTRKQILQGLKLICLFFKQVLKLTKEQKISFQTTQKLFQGVTEYLSLENYYLYSERDKAIYILEVEIKLGAGLEAFNTLINSQEQKHIANSPKQQYEHVWKDIEIVKQNDKYGIRQQYLMMKKLLILTTAATLMESQVQWILAKKIFFGLSYPKYYWDYSLAKLKSYMLYKYPTIKMVKQIWNIPQNGFSRNFIKLTWDNIAFNQKIYIPIQQSIDQQFPDIYTRTKNSIKVRILNYKYLELKGKNGKTCCDFSFFGKKASSEKIDTIMIHMHGGGFIALSSRMMQSMTRKWANGLQIPIFSIDYRKPPQDPFPTAPNDCLTVYKFIVNKISNYMNIQPKNIYLAGDSAGGNLACTLMANVLIHKLPIPKGIYLAYPTLDLRNKFSTSKVNSLLDPLLWPSMLTLILKQYLGGKLQLQQHPLVSPILLTQAFVGGDKNDKRFPLKWPKTFISAGMKDTFYDNSLILMQKLKQSNVECYCRVYQQFCHGYLSTRFMMRECENALIDSVNDLKRLIKEQ